jgi:hypothetical protein
MDVAYPRLRIDVALERLQRHPRRVRALPVHPQHLGFDAVRPAFHLVEPLAGDGGRVDGDAGPRQRMGVSLTRRLRGGTDNQLITRLRSTQYQSNPKGTAVLTTVVLILVGLAALVFILRR